MSRYEVPHDTFGDLSAITRKDTPDVAKVVDAYVADLKTIADQNGGVVPGNAAQAAQRSPGTDPQHVERGLKTSLGNFVNKLDQGYPKSPARPM